VVKAPTRAGLTKGSCGLRGSTTKRAGQRPPELVPHHAERIVREAICRGLVLASAGELSRGHLLGIFKGKARATDVAALLADLAGRGAGGSGRTERTRGRW
jgi:hypothetical protein